MCIRTGIQAVLMSLLGVSAVAQSSPYPPSEAIRDIQFDWSSHMRLATGSDNWPITWAADNNQYVVWGDGGGFGGTNSIGRSSLGVARIEGNWHDFKATNVWGGYKSENTHQITGKSYGLVSVGGTLYMWVGMLQTKNRSIQRGKACLFNGLWRELEILSLGIYAGGRNYDAYCL